MVQVLQCAGQLPVVFCLQRILPSRNIVHCIGVSRSPGLSQGVVGPRVQMEALGQFRAIAQDANEAITQLNNAAAERQALLRMMLRCSSLAIMRHTLVAGQSCRPLLCFH